MTSEKQKIQEQLFSRTTSYFLNKKIKCFWNKKSKVLGQTKPHFSFWLKTNYRKMASNEHVDLTKIENIIRSKCYHEDISKDKGKRHVIFKEKRRVIFDNDRKFLMPQYHSILPYSNTHLKLWIANKVSRLSALS